MIQSDVRDTTLIADLEYGTAPGHSNRHGDCGNESSETDRLNNNHSGMESGAAGQPEVGLAAPIAQPEVITVTGRRRKCLAFELQPEHVSPQHDDYRVFITPQWSAIPQLPYVCYRLAVAILICVWVGVDIIKEGGKFYSDNILIWLIFATNWGFLILALSAVLRAIAAIWHYSESRQKECRAQPATTSFMILWVVYNIAANCALVVTVSYWTFLAAFDSSGFLNTRMCELKHTLNSCYILLDLFASAMPIRFFHMVYPILVGVIYTIFNAVYFINDGLGPDGKSYAYVVMDWNNPIKSALMCSLGFLLAAGMQLILYAVYRLRLFLYASRGRERPIRTSHFPDSDHVSRGGNVGNKAEVESILQEKQDCSSGYSAVELANDVKQLEVIDETSQSLR